MWIHRITVDGLLRMPSDDHISQVSYKLVYAFLLVVKSSINKTDQYNYRQYTVLLCVTENI
jgi:hypothetical protein